MDEYEELLEQISQELPVIEGDISSTGYAALYRNGKIYIDNHSSSLEKKVNLVEEYGHHKKTVGNIIDYKKSESWKEELKARAFAIETLIPVERLIDCSISGYTCKHDCAEFLGVTVEFLEDVLYYYSSKHGPIHLYNGTVINFREDGIIILDSK